MDEFALQISPAAADAARAELETAGHVRLSDVLAPATAERLHDHLADELAWDRIFHQGGRARELEAARLAELSPSALAAIDGLARVGAEREFRYLYDVVRGLATPAERVASGRLLDRLIEAWNSPQALDLWRRLSGRPEAQRLTGSATRYLPGHFLTSHNDSHLETKRFMAYVLNLSPEWRADWGGLLQFADAAGDVSRALVPRFNSLHLFLVPRDHAVSLVAPFAPAPRLAISGWVEG